MLISPIIGKQIDRGYLKEMSYFSIGALGVFSLSFYYLNYLNWVLAIIGLIGWGIQRTGVQIIFASMILKSIDQQHYGTGIGIYYLVSGFATMLSSFLCGYLAKDNFSAVFIFAGVCCLLALIYASYVLKNKELLWENT